MTVSKLELLREKLRAEQQKSQFNKSTTSGEGPMYPHWNIKEEDGNYAAIRFLPDGNEDSSFFWIDKLIIKIPFAGVKGKSTAPIKVNVPCMQMYGETCPILEETKPLWKTDEETARQYYKKRSYIFHGFVRRDGIGEINKPENPIRRFNVNSELFKIIHSGVMDQDMEDLPTDYAKGTDFNIRKTTKGKWADYTTSSWSRKSGPLNEDEALAVEKFGIPELSSYLPKKPTEEELKVIMDMFVDSMNGDPYDAQKYGSYFKPFGLDDDSTGSSVQKGSGDYKTSTKVESEITSDDVDAAVEKSVASGLSVAKPIVAGDKPKTSVQDLLAAINKNKKTS